MLNWRPVRGIELEIEQSKQRTKQIESDILRVRSETEQLRRENARLKQLNARERALSALIKQHCFPPESSSIPAHPTKPECGLSSP